MSIYIFFCLYIFCVTSFKCLIEEKTVGNTAKYFDTPSCVHLPYFFNSKALDMTHDCIVENVEYMPHIYLSKTPATEITQCRAICQGTPQCKYYTLVEPRNSRAEIKETYCYTKPSPSYRTYPLFIHRRYIEDSYYKYTSGSKDGCSQSCVEYPPVDSYCINSTPASCNLVNGLFSFEAFQDFPTTTVSSSLLQCCLSNAGRTTRSQFVYNKVLRHGVTLKSFLSGISSPEECATHCVLTQGCTDWNYVYSPLLQYSGGSCFLKNFEQRVQLELLDAPSTLTSIVGIHCNQMGECQKGPSSPHQQIFKEKPLNPETCLYKNLDSPHILLTNYTISSPEECLPKCVETPGCRYSLVKHNVCHLLYSNYEYTIAEAETTLHDRYCKTIEIQDGCFLIDKAYNSGHTVEYSCVNAEICLGICGRDNRCEGWSYNEGFCYVHENIIELKEQPGWISANSDCKLPPIN